MAVITISTTIPTEMHALAVEKNLKWNEMLILGIKTAMAQPYKPIPGEKIEEETYKAKFEAMKWRNGVLEEFIDRIPDDVMFKLDKLADTPAKSEVLSP